MTLMAAGRNAPSVPALNSAPRLISETDRFGSDKKLFDSFDRQPDGTVARADVIDRLCRAGLATDDSRVNDALSALELDAPGTLARGLTLTDFVKLSHANSGLIGRALRGDLVIPDFAGFAGELINIYEGLLADDRGVVADYIPQLKNIDPDQLAIAVCTVDGQRFSIGQSHAGFCIQSVCKPINYCLALEEHGSEYVHRHVGREPSGRGFNALSFDDAGLPHNPMINAGAIMVCSLLRPDLDMAERFDYIAKSWRQLSGGQRVGFNNAVYLSERQTADRNFALAYSMRESQAFPPGTNLVETLEFYFQCCSIEVDAELVSVVAATLANGGVSPTMSGHVFSMSTVQRCLSLMSSCGMYDFSGEFAFEIGLPAKSGVSGAMMIVIPKVMGICVWSPRLDRNGNSVRGIEFCRELVSRYNFHVFDGLIDNQSGGKRDPRLKSNQAVLGDIMRLCWTAAAGDLNQVRALVESGVDPNIGNYDRRTPLHVAASEGHPDVVAYLLDQGVDPAPVDRWGGTPRGDAERAGHAEVVALFTPHEVVPPVERPTSWGGRYGLPADRSARRAFVRGYSRLLTQVGASGELAQRLETEPAAVLAALGLPTVPGARVTIVRTLDADPDLEAQATLWERGHSTGRYILYVPFIQQIGPGGGRV